MREWLKEQREKKGLTMKEMAEKLGISEGYYSYIEAGERQKKMDITLVTKLADIFRLKIQQIVEYERSVSEDGKQIGT